MYGPTVSRIAAVATAFPEHRYAQGEITDVIAPLLTQDPRKQALLRRMHGASGVDSRHLVRPLEEYRETVGFGETNDRFVVEATKLAASALERALRSAGIAPAELDYLVFTSVTGISAPSVDALLVPLLGLRDDVKRVPMFGLGCVGGAAGIARVHDYLVGHPGEVGALVSVELCSLTVQRGDDSMDSIVASGLFGDGAAAVVMTGDDRPEPGPSIVATASRLFPDSRDVIGFRPTSDGFRVILTGEVGQVVDDNVPAAIVAFLAANGLTPADIGAWVAHPGGPRVLAGIERGLALESGELDRSWRSMRQVGNLSSSSVLHVLADELTGAHTQGAYGLLFALGPGVCAELVLVRWPAAA